MNKEKSIELINSSNMMNNIKLMIENQKAADLSDENPIKTEYYKKVKEKLTSDDFMVEVASIYGDLMSEEDMEQAIAWNNSSAGQNFKNSTALVNERVVPIMDRIVREILEEMGALEEDGE